MNKEELLKQIEELKRQVELLDKPKFEVGKNYLFENHLGRFIINFKSIEDKKVFYNWFASLTHDKEFSTNDWCNLDFYKRPATDKEVEEALIKEAKKRGFKDGVRTTGEIGSTPIVKVCRFNEWDYSRNMLQLYGCCIFRDGKWAEIAKKELINIGGYEVKKNADYYEIGCREIPKCDIKDLSIFMSSQRFTKVSFDGIETDLETINKILNL